jgi:hypothetical protein
MSVSKNAERERQFRNANIFVSSNTNWRTSNGVTVYTDKKETLLEKQVLQMLLSQKELTQMQDTN